MNMKENIIRIQEKIMEFQDRNMKLRKELDPFTEKDMPTNGESDWVVFEALIKHPEFK